MIHNLSNKIENWTGWSIGSSPGLWFMVWLMVHESHEAHKILVSAPVPLELILTGFDWVWAGPWGFAFWDGA